jgi:hypothetical protein
VKALGNSAAMISSIVDAYRCRRSGVAALQGLRLQETRSRITILLRPVSGT